MACLSVVTTLLALLAIDCAAPLHACEAQAPAESFDRSRVRLLDGPFEQIQEQHRTGLVGQLEPAGSSASGWCRRRVRRRDRFNVYPEIHVVGRREVGQEVTR